MQSISPPKFATWLFVIAIVSGVGIGLFAIHNLGEIPTTAENSPSTVEVTYASLETSKNRSDDDRVMLTDDKLRTAQIEVEQVTLGTLTLWQNVAGRVTYNDNRHVQVRAPAAGVLTQVLVKPGDQVEERQVLAWLNCPEIGTARADVLKRKAENKLSQQVFERATVLENHVNELTAALKERPDFYEVERQFASKILQDYRTDLIGAYSRFLLAQAMVSSAKALEQSGALPGKTQLLRQCERQAAEATLSAVCEQAEMDVWQKRSLAKVSAHDARRRLEISRQHLASLLTSRGISGQDPTISSDQELGACDDNLHTLTRVPIRAPFSGTIEQRLYTTSERVQTSDSLFVLADIHSLWITAELRENEWSAISLQAGQILRVTVPALGNRSLQAKVYYVGRQVSAETNAIPIVATIDNPDQQLRPGLFVHTGVPVKTLLNVLTVPSASVLHHDRQTFVFVRTGEHDFQKFPVHTGQVEHDRIEIISGLDAGQLVVTHGGFLLKSELLLDNNQE